MNPIVMSMLVDAKLNDVFREAADARVLKSLQEGDKAGFGKSLVIIVAVLGVIFLVTNLVN